MVWDGPLLCLASCRALRLPSGVLHSVLVVFACDAKAPVLPIVVAALVAWLGAACSCAGDGVVCLFVACVSASFLLRFGGHF